jgi:hypothetical protein
MALSQVRDTPFHHMNSQGKNHRTSAPSLSLGTSYDVQGIAEVDDAVMIAGMSEAEKDKPSDKHCQIQGMNFLFQWTFLRQQFFSYGTLCFIATKGPLNTVLQHQPFPCLQVLMQLSPYPTGSPISNLFYLLNYFHLFTKHKLLYKHHH